MAAKPKSEFEAVHKQLKAILKKYAGRGLAAQDKPGDYCLIGPPTATSQGKDVWFGAVQIRKSYVSYHLMPVYAFPELLAGTSPTLRERMQGKSCFNFKEPDAQLFTELAKLTEKGYKRFQKAKLIG